MPKLILWLDGVEVKQIELGKNRSTIGRRPYNDIVIENLAVSGEHAVIEIIGDQTVLQDMGSTNGTYVNGKPIRKQAIEDGDRIAIGKYKIEYVASPGYATPGLQSVGRTIVGEGGSPANLPTIPASLPATPTAPDGHATQGPRVRVLNGASAGKSLALTKVVSTVGNPNVSVASIIRRGNGYDLAHVTGDQVVLVNGVSAGDGSVALKHGDRIDVGGAQLEFLDH